MQQQLQGPGAAQPAVPQGAQFASQGAGFEVTHGPSFAMLRLDVRPGEVVVAEAGSMVARHQHVRMEPKLNAPPGAGFFAVLKAFFVALIRKLVGGESFVVNHFTATGQPGSVWLAPVLSGQIHHKRLQPGQTLVMSTGAYVAHRGNVHLKLRFGGLSGLLAKEGLFFLEASGEGDLWFNSYGGIHALRVDGSFVVDTGHIVAYEGSLQFRVTSAGGGLKGLFASGEGLVAEFQGQGIVYVQTRSLGALVDWLSPMLPS